ncbi:MAG: hypothetical protein NTV31_03835, partial [Bacteroidia bacterium]|nr:hypothetical protein [Bacteroidia bacterium]
VFLLLSFILVLAAFKVTADGAGAYFAETVDFREVRDLDYGGHFLRGFQDKRQKSQDKSMEQDKRQKEKGKRQKEKDKRKKTKG